MRIGLLTSVDVRHRYFANALASRFDVAAVGYEQTGYDPASTGGMKLDESDEDIIRHHFEERVRQESLYFGHDSDFLEQRSGRSVLRIAPGELNSTRTREFLSVSDLAVLVVYGTNLLREPLLSDWAGRIVNLHLGLSPYYRGTATNFYPLYNGEPQYVGATIHLIDKGIDSGPILRHARPEIVADDQPHTIGCKAILAGTEAMIDVLQGWAGGDRFTVQQWGPAKPRLYLRKHYHPRQVVELYEKLKAGMIPGYVERLGRGAVPEVRLVTGSPLASWAV
jgi:hypothetical protein